MSWLPDGRFSSDLAPNGDPYTSGADVPDLEKRLREIHDQEK